MPCAICPLCRTRTTNKVHVFTIEDEQGLRLALAHLAFCVCDLNGFTIAYALRTPLACARCSNKHRFYFCSLKEFLVILTMKTMSVIRKMSPPTIARLIEATA